MTSASRDWQTSLTAGFSSDVGYLNGRLDQVTVESEAKSSTDLLLMAVNGHPDTQTVEICDGLDNDCDGTIDEEGAVGCALRWQDKDWDGYGSGTAKCLCSSDGGYTATVGGDCDDWNDAVSPNKEDICDAVDNDCDGEVDNIAGQQTILAKHCYSGPPETEGVGMCQGGVSSCVNGSWSVCVGEVVPAAEVCDGLDQDCDGVSDTDEPGESTAPSDHPCDVEPWCDFGVCYCMLNTTTNAWSCILE